MTKLTDKQVRALSCPPGKTQQRRMDSEFPGFGVRVTLSGCRSFFLNYTIAGRERRITIGRYPSWSVARARARASELRRMVDLGEDPLDTKKSERDSFTVLDLFERYCRECLPTKSEKTADNESSMWRRFVLPKLGDRKLSSLKPEDIDKLHSEISVSTRVQANRCVASLRNAFNMAKRWELIDRNPANGVKLNPELPRERYLSRDEGTRFVQALRARDEDVSTLAIEFLLLTGSRKGEVLEARWQDIDLERGVWTKPSAHTKQKRVHRIPLTDQALDVLKRVQRHSDNTMYVFPGPNGKPLGDVRKTFKAICRAAEISDFRIHDLRHSFASVLASSGVSLPIIGQLLGHTQPTTTQRYSHLMDEPLREAAGLAAGQFSIP